MTIGAVVVGTGFGARVHVPALRAAGFDVLALVGRDAERTARRRAAGHRARVHVARRRAGTCRRVQAVTIAAPPDHARRARDRSLRRRPARDLREAIRPRRGRGRGDDGGRRAGRCHRVVGHEFRWAPDRALAARAIADGLIGEPRLATLVQYVPLVADPEARVPEWWFDEARRRLAGRVGVAHRRPGAVLVRRARLGQRDAPDRRRALGRRGLVRRTGDVAIGCRDRDAADGRVVDAGRRRPDRGGRYRRHARGRRRRRVVLRSVGPAPARGARRSRAPGVTRRERRPAHRYTHLELGPYTRLCEALRAGIEGRDRARRTFRPDVRRRLACMRVLDAIRASAAAGGATVTVSE